MPELVRKLLLGPLVLDQEDLARLGRGKAQVVLAEGEVDHPVDRQGRLPPASTSAEHDERLPRDHGSAVAIGGERRHRVTRLVQERAERLGERGYYVGG